MTIAITTACPVLDSRCSCRYVNKPVSARLQFISCLNMGLLQQVPAFDVSYGETELLVVSTNTTIVRLQSQAFAYVKTRRLLLRGLNITVVDHLVFSGLEEIIISIDLGDNSISQLPYDTFFRLTRLTTIKLDGNKIAVHDQSTFRRMSQLRFISLGNNLLHQLAPVLFRDLINLQILQLQGNDILTIAEDLLANLRNLEELDMSDNRLSTISADAFASLTNLKHLNLSGNMFTGILTSSFLQQLGKLTKLNVSRNDISALKSDAFQGCRQLTVVDLSNNRLTLIQSSDVTQTFRLEHQLYWVYSGWLIWREQFSRGAWSLWQCSRWYRPISSQRFASSASRPVEKLSVGNTFVSFQKSGESRLFGRQRQPTGKSVGRTITTAVRRDHDWWQQINCSRVGWTVC